MSLFDRIQRTIHGRDFGLDRNNNLLMKGSQIILAYDSASPVTISGASAGGAAVYSVSMSANLAATQNDYVIGVKSRALLTAFAGGSIVTGIQASDFSDGQTLMIVNPSATNGITFKHLSASSIAANRFSCRNGVDAVLDPLAATTLVYVVNQWKFK